jgi:hypothetical protein
MRVPQVKEGPAQALRAMFAGIGSLLSVTDKIRSKPGAPESGKAPADVPTPAADKPAAEAVAPAQTVTEVTEPEPQVAAEPAILAESSVVVEETLSEPEPVAAVDPVGTSSAAPPLPNYDDLSVASLRARLRNLSTGQLTELIEYEKAHQARAEVVTMFERRIAKIQAEA